MKHNVVSRRPTSDFAGDRWKAFDELPNRLRFALAESTLNWCAGRMLELWREAIKRHCAPSVIETDLIRMLRRSEDGEIAEWSGSYKKATGFLLPHIAAGADIQRYDACARSRPWSQPW